MKPEVFTQSSSNVHTANQVLKFAVVVLSISSFLTMCVAAYAIGTHKTVFIPPGIEKEIWVSNSDASDEYIVTVSKYAIYLLSNYNPTTVRSQYQELRQWISADYFPQFDRTLRTNEDTIKKLLITSAYYPQSFFLEKANHTITVKGIKRQYAMDNMINTGAVDYKIVYSIKNRRMFIHEISELGSK